MELASDFTTFLSSIQPGDDEVAPRRPRMKRSVINCARTESPRKPTRIPFFRFLCSPHCHQRHQRCRRNLHPGHRSHDHRPRSRLAGFKEFLRSITRRRTPGQVHWRERGKGVWLDIVPATPVSADDGPLWIPDRDAEQWVQTHPKGQIAAGISKNKVTNGYFVQVVKLLQILARHALYRIRAIEIIHTRSANSRDYRQSFFSRGSDSECTRRNRTNLRLVTAIWNRAGHLRSWIHVRERGETVVRSSEFSDFMAQVKSAAATARRAIDDTNEATSRKLWRQIFGPQFGQ